MMYNKVFEMVTELAIWIIKRVLLSNLIIRFIVEDRIAHSLGSYNSDKFL